MSEIKVEVELNQEKINFKNDSYEKGLQYWKRIASENVSTENERKLIELEPKKVILACKEKNQKLVNIEEMIFYLKFRYLEHNENKTIIANIRSEEPSFEVITNNLETFLKSRKDQENIGLKNKDRVCRWFLMTAKKYKR